MKKRFGVALPHNIRSVLKGVDPRLKQRAYDRLAILREYNFRLSKPREPKTKTKVRDQFLGDLNSGVLFSDGAMSRIRHVGRATLYYWDRAYKKGGLAALVPRYGVKPSTGKATYRPLAMPIEMKFPGRPRARGKKEFIARIKRRWKNPPLECPIRLSIFYFMGIPEGTRMAIRMAMLKGKISHKRTPNLDVLNRFVVKCMNGIVLKKHSQIVQFYSEKSFAWFPQIRILIKPLPG